MKNIAWIHKIHKTAKNTEKMSIKEDWLYFVIGTQQPTLLNIWLLPVVFCSHDYSISCKLK